MADTLPVSPQSVVPEQPRVTPPLVIPLSRVDTTNPTPIVDPILPVVSGVGKAGEKELASVFNRGMAAFIDSLILSFPGFLVIVSLFVREILSNPDNFFIDIQNKTHLFGILMVGTLILQALYFGYCTAKTGQTFGKKVIKIRVIDESIRQPSVTRMWVRELSKFGMLIIPQLVSLLPFVSVVLVIFTKKKQALHDLIASTQVVKSDISAGSLKEVKMGLMILYLLSVTVSAVVIAGLFPSLR